MILFSIFGKNKCIIVRRLKQIKIGTKIKSKNLC